MHSHTPRTPRPAAVPPAARGLPGSVSRALARLAATTTLPKAERPRPLTPALTDALLNLRAADPTFDANPGLRALRKALAGRVRERLAGVEADVAILDMLGGDPDLEATGDDEPSLCGVGSHELRGNSASIAGGCEYGAHPYDIEGDPADGPEGDDEREEENEHGGDVQDEPHDPEEDAHESEVGLDVAGFDGLNYARPRRQRPGGFQPGGLRIVGPDGLDYLVSSAIR